jgi:hypothetical protein
MNRYRIGEDVDSARAAYGSAGALFAAAFIVVLAVFCHSRAGAMPSIDPMDVATPSPVFQAGTGSAFRLN